MPPTIDELVVADPPEAWERAGFDVDRDGYVRIGNVRIRLTGGADEDGGLVTWTLRDLPPADNGPGVTTVDGLDTRPSDRPPPEPAQHPNGSVVIDHVVVSTPDPPRTTSALESVGLEVRRVRETGTPEAPVIQTFFRAGEVVVELVGPASSRPDRGPAAFFGLAISVRDLDDTAALLGERLGMPKDAVQEGRRIATLRHRACGMSVPTAFMSVA
ncbi:MAG: glyoxalase [Acidimicrobiia bacterium]|nr:glyoxalase [Acidimicrobiia bacterium]